MANQYQMQAVDSVDGALYQWLATSLDWAGSGYDGPNDPTEIAVVGIRPGEAGAISLDASHEISDGTPDGKYVVTDTATISLPATPVLGAEFEIVKALGTFVLTISGNGNNVQANEAGSFRDSVMTPSQYQTTSYRYMWDGSNWVAVGPIGFRGARVSLSTRAAIQSDAQQILVVAGTVSYTVNSNTITRGDRVDFIVVSGSLTIVQGSNADIGFNAAKSLVFAAGTVGSLQALSDYGDTPQEFWLFGEMT